MRSLILDRGGNTLAIMAAALIPLSAMAGSAVDMARMYVVKVRLQQACDAGVLAGRKFMTLDSGSSLGTTATTRAQAFFDNNFKVGWYGTSAPTPRFVASRTSDNQVSGVATITLPMTVMKMFGKPDVVMSTTCMARFDVADVDTMFVLDTTGSMTCAADESVCTMTSETYTRSDGTTGYSYAEKSSSKIKALRSAVLAYFDTLKSSADAATKLRFGFVTYASTVNAGAAIPAAFMVSPQWAYQSRRAIGDANDGRAYTSTGTGFSKSSCQDYDNQRNPQTGWDANSRAILYSNPSWSSRNGGTCSVTTQSLRPLWRYDDWNTDVGGFLAGNSVQDPSKVVTAMTRWAGCIEERVTTPGVTSFDQANLPADLDPDRVPTDNATRWRPMWPESIYIRSNAGSASQDTASDLNAIGSASNQQGGFAACGKPVQRLAALDRTAVSNYVNAVDFRAIGGTYHDVGMIWGTRLLSPTGVFAQDTAAWPNRNAPNRNIIFMTDGAMAPNESIYGMYGLEWSDQRVSGGDFDNLTAYHNARFLAECDAAKARNITVWVVAFGQTINDELRDCASTPDRAFFASDNATLTTQFQSIARRIAMLRLSQ